MAGLKRNGRGSVSARRPFSRLWRHTGNTSPISTIACKTFTRRAKPLWSGLGWLSNTRMKAVHRPALAVGRRRASLKSAPLSPRFTLQRPTPGAASAGGTADPSAAVGCFKKRSKCPGRQHRSRSYGVQHSSNGASFSIFLKSSSRLHNASRAATATRSSTSEPQVSRAETIACSCLLARHASSSAGSAQSPTTWRSATNACSSRQKPSMDTFS
mmetsp:Transcript_45446/g.126140  ORF Transcript_45446/g.126140 Transcript_45446/m.126140 type:complete len:214 (-) Transcript_45446:275-916(-)